MELDVQFTDSRRLKSLPVIHLEPGTAVRLISQPKTGRQRRTEAVMMLKTQRRRNEKPVICLPQIGNIHRHMICGVGFPLFGETCRIISKTSPFISNIPIVPAERKSMTFRFHRILCLKEISAVPRIVAVFFREIPIQVSCKKRRQSLQVPSVIGIGIFLHTAHTRTNHIIIFSRATRILRGEIKSIPADIFPPSSIYRHLHAPHAQIGISIR